MPLSRRKSLILGRPAKGGMTPVSLGSALSLWLDSNDPATLYDSNSGGSLVSNDGAAIGRWQDKSGNGRHFSQSTVGDRPTLGASGANLINGKPSIVFNWAVSDNASGSKSLQGPTASDLIPTGTTPATDCHSFWFVVQRIAASVNRKMFEDGTPNYVVWNGNPATGLDFIPRSGVTVSAAGLALDTTYIVHVRRVAGTDVRSSINGGPENVTTNNQTLTIANNVHMPGMAASFKQKLRICEVIGHRGPAMTLAERNGIGQYLAAKWGVTWTPQTS